jgi:hypothetical protein
MHVAIDVIASIDKQGDMSPLYLTYKKFEFKIENILGMKKENFASIHRLVYKCYNFSLKEFSLIYDIKSSIWYYVEVESK